MSLNPEAYLRLMSMSGTGLIIQSQADSYILLLFLINYDIHQNNDSFHIWFLSHDCVPLIFSAVLEMMKLNTVQHLLEPILEPLIRKVVSVSF